MIDHTSSPRSVASQHHTSSAVTDQFLHHHHHHQHHHPPPPLFKASLLPPELLPALSSLFTNIIIMAFSKVVDHLCTLCRIRVDQHNTLLRA